MLGRGTLVGVLNTGLGAVLGIASLNFITVYAASPAYGGARVLGAWAYGLALLGLINVVTNLGYPQAHIRRLSAGHEEAHAMGTFFAVKLVLTGAFVAFGLGAFWVTTRVLGLQPTDVTFTLVLLAVVYYVVLSLRNFFDFSFHGRRLFVVAESVLLVDTLFTVAFTMATALAIGSANGVRVPFPSLGEAAAAALRLEGPLDLFAAAAYLGAAQVAAKTLSFLYAGFQFAVHRYAVGPPDRNTFAQYHAFAKPLVIVSVLAVLIQQIDKVYIGQFWGTAEVGQFEIALRLVTPPLLMSVVLGNVFFPVASRHHADERHEDIRSLFGQAERYLSLFMLGVVMLILVFHREAVDVVTSGTAGRDPGLILVAFVPFLYFGSLGVLPRSALLATDRTKTVARLSAMYLAIVLILNTLLVPSDIRRLGLTDLPGLKGLGAAIAASLATLFAYAYMRWKARGWVPNTVLPRDFIRQAAAAAVVGTGLWALRGALAPITRLWQLLTVGALGFAAYMGALVLLRGFTRDDYNQFAATFHLPRFARYVGHELSGKAKDEPPRKPPPGLK